MKRKIEKFISDLANTKASEDAKNPWDYTRSSNEIRRKNLEGYLTRMSLLEPKVILIGEAPGYRGCGRVGMPFSSEKLLLSHPFFEDKKIFGIENEDAPIAEASATIVWKTFDSLNFYPLMWASYPFHPHQPGKIESNRTPRGEEVLLGRVFVKNLLEMFNIQKIVAVGKVAEKNLTEMNLVSTPIRHPSHGGATLFTQGLADFVKNTKL